ncbi:hypothetical protein Tco_1237727 [Tanacetum coccineum]
MTTSTSDRHLIEVENQVQRLIEAHLAPMQLTQVNKITSSCEICSGPHDTQYCMENPEQAFVEYASSRTDEAGGKWYTFKPEQNNLGDAYNPSWKSHPNLSQSNLEGLVSNFMASQDARLSKFEVDFKQQQSEMTNKIDTVLKAITDRIAGALPSDTVKNPKLNVNSTTSVLSAHSYPTDDPQCSTHIHDSINTITIHPEQQSDSMTIKFVYTKGDDGDVMFIEIVKKNDDSRKEEPEVGGLEVEYFDIFPTQSELAYWKRISEKRMKNQAKNDKTKHGMEKRKKDKVKSKTKSKKPKSTPRSQRPWVSASWKAIGRVNKLLRAYCLAQKLRTFNCLRAPTKDNAEAIVGSTILAEHFELKHCLAAEGNTFLEYHDNIQDTLQQATYGTYVPMPQPFINPEEDERVDETLTDPEHGNGFYSRRFVDKNSSNDNLVDTISEMFTDEHALDYSSPPLWDDYDDELFDLRPLMMITL